jgi:hypothetical protein
MNSLAAWMQYITFNRIQMFPTVDTIIKDGFKVGTVVCKQWWEETSLNTVSGRDVSGVLQETAITDANQKIDVVAFEDFYPFPVTAKRLEFCEIMFQRLRLTKQQVINNRDSGKWAKEACETLLKGPNSTGGSQATAQQATQQGISLTPDVGRPYDAIEAHFTYSLSPGKKYSLIAVFNPQVNSELSLLRFYHKPGSNPFDCAFTDFRPMPRDDSFYGDCVPQILEDSQEEQAQIHNSRRDNSTIANIPGWKKKRYADVANPSTEWYPGKVFEVDNMDDLVPLEYGRDYNSMVEEEQFLLTLAERYTGVSPAMQGMGAGVNGKKGSYASQGTLAMIAEGNRRIDIYLKRMRMPFNKIGRNTYTSYRDFGDPNDWKQWGQHASNLVELFQRDSTLQGGNTFFELSASDAGANRETDRSGLLLMANTMSAYYHELVQAAQAIVSAPPNSPFSQLMLQVLDGARDLANRLLFVFDIGDRDILLPDLRKLLGQPGGDGQPPQPGPGSVAQQGLPSPQGDVSVGGVQDLSQQLTQLTSGLRTGSGGQQGPGESPIQ